MRRQLGDSFRPICQAVPAGVTDLDAPNWSAAEPRLAKF
jgi:hypothetical protein